MLHQFSRYIYYQQKIRSSLNKKGFTLIELLVVISIIIVLSIIVIVSLSIMRDRARIAAGLYFEQSLHQVAGAELVGEWLFEQYDSTTAHDSSGYGANALFYNGINPSTDFEDNPVVAGKAIRLYPGSIMHLGGGIPPAACSGCSQLGLSSEITISVWIRIMGTSGSGVWPNIIKTVKGGSWDMCADNARGFLLGLGADEDEWLGDEGRVIYSATGDTNIGWCYTSVGRTPVNDGKWHHIAATSSQAQDRTII